MIYITQYDPMTKEVIGHSQDSGLTSLADAKVTMGEPVRESKRLMLFEGGIAISDYPFKLEADDDSITSKV